MVQEGYLTYSSVISLLDSLHWLPIGTYIKIRSMVLAFRAINGLAPICLLKTYLCPFPPPLVSKPTSLGALSTMREAFLMCASPSIEWAAASHPIIRLSSHLQETPQDSSIPGTSLLDHTTAPSLYDLGAALCLIRFLIFFGKCCVALVPVLFTLVTGHSLDAQHDWPYA